MRQLTPCIGMLFFAATTAAQIESPRPASGLAAARALESALIASIAKAEKSVVAIARGRRGDRADLSDQQFVPHEYGTGVVVDANGLILTNYHTLGEVARHDYVVWLSGKPYSKVRVLAADPWTDLAILETDARNLQPIKWSSGADVKKGQLAIALGNPFGIARDGNVSATWGMIANVRRKIDGPLARPNTLDSVPLRNRETRYHYGALIQTDAKLARGTSGGPLLDLDGNMIGLMTTVAMLAGFEKGMGYAIPVDETFRSVVEKLKRGEAIEQGFLGVAPRNPDFNTGEEGVILERVEPGTPAGRAGLFAMDEILQIDKQPIHNIDDLFLKVGSLPPDRIVQIRIRRRAKTITVPVRLTKKPEFASRPAIVTASQRGWRGLRVDHSTSLATRRVTDLDPEGCVIVVEAREDSPAWQAGLRVGHLISHVGGQRITRPAEFWGAVANRDHDVELTLFEVSETTQVVVKPSR